MATEYHIYKNDGAGGPVDYSTILATVAGLSYATAALAFSSSCTFAVRAFDPVSGLEESNVDARVTIVTGTAGADVSAVPSTPTMLGLAAKEGGTCRVDWLWVAATGTAPATGFSVYLTAGTTTTYGTPAATVAHVPGLSRYSATLTGLSDGVAYVVSVRATNAAGDDGGTDAIAVVGSATAPANVDDLAAVATIVP